MSRRFCLVLPLVFSLFVVQLAQADSALAGETPLQTVTSTASAETTVVPTESVLPSASPELTPAPFPISSGPASSSAGATPEPSLSIGTTVICSPEAPPGALDPDAR